MADGIVLAILGILCLSGLYAILGHKGAVPTPRSCELMRFLQNISSERAEVGFGGAFSYEYTAHIHFPESGVRIELEYNRIRHEWDLDVYAKGEIIFGELSEPISPFKWHPPQAAVEFLLDKYNLRDRFQSAAKKDSDKIRRKEQEAQRIKDSVLAKGVNQ